MFQPGLQSHFPNGRVEPSKLAALASRVYWHRMDVQQADKATSLQIYQDILDLQRRPLITCWSGEEARWFPPSDVEYQNERSINLGGVPAIPGDVYRRNWDTDFWPAVVASGHRAYFGAAANFETRDLNWYRAAKPHTLPPEVVCTIHDYWTGNEASLAARLKTWREIIGMDRPYLISECGADLADPLQLAAYMQRKWAFWQVQPLCQGLVHFQILDDRTLGIHMGVYDADWQIKPPVFDVFPLVHTGGPIPGESMQATQAIHRRDLIPKGDGKYTVRYPIGATTVMSIQPGGEIQTRVAGTQGPWETATDDGTRLVFEDVNGEAWAFPLVG